MNIYIMWGSCFHMSSYSAPVRAEHQWRQASLPVILKHVNADDIH